jgi:hypothetical protein
MGGVERDGDGDGEEDAAVIGFIVAALAVAVTEAVVVLYFDLFIVE